MRVAHPQFLLLLIPIAALLYLLARRESAYRPWLHFPLRLLVASAAVLAASGVETRRPDYSFERFVLLDVSDSAGLDAEAALREIGEIANGMDRRDRLAVIAFGRDPSLEFGPASPGTFALKELGSSVVKSSTDIAAALALARSMHTANAAGQIVLVSDGNETAGNARSEALRLAADRLPVYCLAIERGAGDFRVRVVDYPQDVRPGQTFRVTVEVAGVGRTHVALRTDEGVSGEDDLVVNGRTLWRAEMALHSPGLHLIEAGIVSADDPVPQNDKCMAAVRVEGPASLLWISAENSSLAEAAKKTFAVTEIKPTQVPASAADLQPYDAVIIEDCRASELSTASMASLRTYVGRMGGGLIMLGGGRAFGPGGYIGSPVEEALPVECDPEEQASKPVWLVAVVDRSGSMAEKAGGRTKLSFAQEGVLHVIEQLKEEDRIAVIAFHGASEVVVPLGSARNKQRLREKILGLDAHGSTDLNAPLEDALKQLAGANDDALKHVIVLSDGLSKSPVNVDEWARRFSVAGVSVSVVATGDQADRKLLKGLADGTGGRFYSVDNIENVLDILEQEARPSIRKLIRRSDDGFAVRLLESSLTEGLSGPPSIPEYVFVNPKGAAETAIEVDDGKTLLAIWRFGVGRSAAFAAPAGMLAGWEDAGALWAHIIGWVARGPGEESLTTTITIDRGIARVEVADGTGGLKDYRAQVVSPSGEAFTIRLQQAAPGLYAGEFAVDVPGVYPVTIVENSDAGPTLKDKAAAVLSYSQEWSETRADRGFLAGIGEATGGGMVKDLGELPAPADTDTRAFGNMSWLPALLALILFLIELAIP